MKQKTQYKASAGTIKVSIYVSY